MRSLQSKPYMLNNKEGQLLQSLGASVSIKATSEQTGGLFNLFEVCCPPDYATPLDIHYTEDVAVFPLREFMALPPCEPESTVERAA